MQTENSTTNEKQPDEKQPEIITEQKPQASSAEAVPTMDDFKEQIEHSFKKINEGEILKGTVIGVSDTEVTLDLGYYTEGIIKLEELSNNPQFSIKTDVTPGEEISAVVVSKDDGHGNILLSKKKADDILAWERLTEDMTSKKVINIKIVQAVKSGVITYLYGIRAFIPASQLSIAYVEDLDTWIGKEIDVIIITASEKDKKLILSGKKVEKDNIMKDKDNKISKLQIGIVTKGIVKKIVPYGAFVDIGDGLNGLVHISQICVKRINSPNEIIKEGEEVTVKIIDIKDGKISLSMKAVEDTSKVFKNAKNAPSNYSTGGEATTGLADLLKNIKL
jgi:small subunit ribosomal protein S1